MFPIPQFELNTNAPNNAVHGVLTNQTPGDYLFTVPDGVYTLWLSGSAPGGAGAAGSSGVRGGGGGGSGGSFLDYPCNVTPGMVIPYHIPNSGEDFSFGSFITAVRGSPASTSNGGAAGTCAQGMDGQQGQNAMTATPFIGGDGAPSLFGKGGAGGKSGDNGRQGYGFGAGGGGGSGLGASGSAGAQAIGFCTIKW